MTIDTVSFNPAGGPAVPNRLGARDVLDHMRVGGPKYEAVQIYQVGHADTRVTIPAQQRRAFNLTWALRAEKVVGPGVRVAIIGAGASGLSAVAGLYNSGVEITLFEKSARPMRLQAANRTRYIDTDQWAWPFRDGVAYSAMLPALDWYSGYSFEVAHRILAQFAAYAGSYQPLFSTTVMPLQPVGSAVELKFVSAAGGVIKEGAQSFDVVILATGFGLESAVPGFDLLSYWSNDTFEEEFVIPALPDLVVGAGDGGLTDVIRLALPEFRHELLNQIAHIPSTRELARQLVAFERAGQTPFEHDEMYRNVSCDPELVEVLGRLAPSRFPAQITTRSDLLFGKGANTINKVVVRHLMEMGRVKYVPFEQLSMPSATPGEPSELDPAIKPKYRHVVTRTGPERTFAQMCPGGIAKGGDAGLAMGSHNLFPKGFFPRPPVKVSKLLVLTAGTSNKPGGGSAGELESIKRTLNATMGIENYRIETRNYDPRIGNYAQILSDVSQSVATRNPDILIVMGSDLVPILTPASLKAWPLLKRRHRSIMEIAGDRPVVFFGAAEPIGRDRHDNLFVAQQFVDDLDIIRAIGSAFPGDTVRFVFNPHYPIDIFFMLAIRRGYLALRKAEEVSFRLQLRPIITQGRGTVARLERSYERAHKRGERVITIGRMTTHMLAHEHNLMWRVPCLSSYAEDVSQGAIVGYDNDDEACARELVSTFIRPLLEGRKVTTHAMLVDDRKMRGSPESALRFGIVLPHDLSNEMNQR